MQIRLRAMGRFANFFSRSEMILTLEENATVSELLAHLKDHYNLAVEGSDDLVVLIDGIPVDEPQRVLHGHETVSILHMIPGG